MSWIDYLIAGVVIVMVITYVMRGREGAGIAIFDAVAFVVSTWAGHAIYRRVSEAVGLSPALVYIVIFVVVAFLLLLASARLYALTMLNISPLNGVLSFVFGVVTGWAICYAMLDVTTISVTQDSALGQAISASKFAPEILKFRTISGNVARFDSTSFRRLDTTDRW